MLEVYEGILDGVDDVVEEDVLGDAVADNAAELTEGDEGEGGVVVGGFDAGEEELDAVNEAEFFKVGFGV